jgi:hypothetical protein
MKNIFSYFLVVLLVTLSLPVFATDYYSTTSGNANDLSTWNSSRSGNGSMPRDFNDPNDNFIVVNKSTITSNGFACKGSVIIETGGILVTGKPGGITNVATVVTINQGGVLKLSRKTTIIAGFMLIQGTLENAGGKIRFNNPVVAAPVAAL